MLGDAGRLGSPGSRGSQGDKGSDGQLGPRGPHAGMESSDLILNHLLYSLKCLVVIRVILVLPVKLGAEGF